jgi:hypothetical protein
MFQILILLSCVFPAYAEILYQHKFLLDNENWFIIGNKNYEPAVHQSYNIDKSLSHYIMFKDNLINVDSVNKNDRTLWYFKSPDILINEEYKPGSNQNIKNKKILKTPKLLTFTMNSFVGDFNKLNENVALVKLKNKNNNKILVFKAPQYDGNSREFNVPFISSLWEREDNNKSNNLVVTQEELNNMFIGTFSIEILGDWTQGMEVVGLDNVIIM